MVQVEMPHEYGLNEPPRHGQIAHHLESSLCHMHAQPYSSMSVLVCAVHVWMGTSLVKYKHRPLETRQVPHFHF